MGQKHTRWLLAAIQAIIGWEWLMSGGNKLLSGTFPQGLAGTLIPLLKKNPDSWYVAFIQHTILPQSVLYGYLIEWTEVTLGLLFLGGAVILLSPLQSVEQKQDRVAAAYSIAAMCASVIGAVLTINFHFLMGGWVFPWFDGAAANGEGIDLDALLPPFELVIFLAQGALLSELTGVRWRTRFQRLIRCVFPRKPLPSPQTSPAPEMPLTETTSRTAA